MNIKLIVAMLREQKRGIRADAAPVYSNLLNDALLEAIARISSVFHAGQVCHSSTIFQHGQLLAPISDLFCTQRLLRGPLTERPMTVIVLHRPKIEQIF